MIGNPSAEAFVMAVLLTLLAAVTLAIARQRNMFGVVILSSIYSFLMASLMIVLDAVDVAMTEASVGAGISTVILLATLYLTGSMEYPQRRSVAIPLFVSIVVGAALVWGTIGLPAFGISNAPIHEHVAPTYIEFSKKHDMPPNIVTAVLADFRSFDTLGETTVVFTAGIGVLLLLQGGWRASGSRRKDETEGDDEI
jgi:multicomponent Na+:H+ antiporter subunit B